MKILHILSSNSYSGAENVVCQIIENFKDIEGFEMAYSSKNGDIQDVLNQKNILFYGMDSASCKEIKRVIKEYKPDTIHAHDFNASVKTSLITNLPIISHLHNNPLWLQKINLRTITYALTSLRFKKILGVSNAVKNEFIFKNVISRKYITLGNVINMTPVLSFGEETCESYDILFVGRLTEQKNPLLFLKIVQIIRHKYPLIKVGMVGDGEMFKQCQFFCENNNLNVDFLGFQSNPYKYMKHATMLVMPSSWEGFGLVAIESMLLGTPVICSGVGGLKDIITEDFGYICNSIDEYVQAAIDVLTLKAEKKLGSLNEKVKQRARLYTDTSEYTKNLIKIYRHSMEQ